MSVYKKVQVVCWSIVLVVFVGLGVWFVTRVNYGSWNISLNTESLNGPYNEMGRYTLDASKIRNLSVSWLAGDVIISPHEEKNITIIEYAQRELKEDEELKLNTSRDTLSIDYCTGNINMLIPAKKLEVFIPEEIAENLDNVIIDRTSSDLMMYDIVAEEIELDSSSGNSLLKNIKATRMDIDMTSGDAELHDGEITKLYISSSSGDSEIYKSEISNLLVNATSGEITINDLVGEELSINTSSGDSKLDQVIINKASFDSTSGTVKFMGSFKTLQGDSTSGNYYITNDIEPESFSFNTSSGNVTLTLPESDDLNISYDTSSGDLESELPIMQKGKSSYKVNTTSGDLTIKKLD